MGGQSLSAYANGVFGSSAPATGNVPFPPLPARPFNQGLYPSSSLGMDFLSSEFDFNGTLLDEWSQVDLLQKLLDEPVAQTGLFDFDLASL